MVKGDTKNYLFVAPNGTRMKGKVQAMDFLDKNGGTEEEKKLLVETSLDEGNREEQDGEDHLKEVVREKAAELFDELVVVDTANGRMVVNQVLDTEDELMVVHPENGKESVHFNFKADTADLFFIDHRYVVVANKSETYFQLFPPGW